MRGSLGLLNMTRMIRYMIAIKYEGNIAKIKQFTNEIYITEECVAELS